MTDIIPVKIVPLWVKVVVILVLFLLVVGGGWWIGNRLTALSDENKALRASDTALREMIGAEQAKNARQDQIFAARDTQQNEVRAGVADVTVRIKQEKANDPATRVVLDTRIPDGLRRALGKAPASGSAAECKGADCPHGH